MEIGPFSVQSISSPSLFVLGPATATIVRSGIGTLETSIETGSWVQGGSVSAPTSGIVTTTATDGTSVKATVSAGSAVRLDVDTNGDSAYEGTQNTSWDALLY